MVTCRASSEHPKMPQVVLLHCLHKTPCDSTSCTGTQVPTIHDPLRSPSHEQDPRKRNAPLSRVPRAAPLMLNEQTKIPAQRNRQPARPTPRPRPPPHPGKATPCPVLHWPALWNHNKITAVSSGATWTLQPRNFLRTCITQSPEYFRHRTG